MLERFTAECQILPLINLQNLANQQIVVELDLDGIEAPAMVHPKNGQYKRLPARHAGRSPMARMAPTKVIQNQARNLEPMGV
ncbi:MAG: hypothetical protein HQL31_07640 [Planctomycetes bacterium]|nr:hypothetical protein [Planctomycetota bacterium]